MNCEHGATPCTRIFPSRWPDDARGHWCLPAGELECSPVPEAERIARTGGPAADVIERGDHTG
jgi:hypothetical protein